MPASVTLLHISASAQLSDSSIAGPGVRPRANISRFNFQCLIGGPRFYCSGCIDSLVVICVSFATAKKRPKKLIATPWEHHSTFSSDYWAHAIEVFLIQLSDQQLFLGLVVLICAFMKYYRYALGSNDNLWHAGDVACFSMASHAITLLALRECLRENKILAGIRVLLMIIIFGLWMKIGYLMLRPDGPLQGTTNRILLPNGYINRILRNTLGLYINLRSSFYFQRSS